MNQQQQGARGARRPIRALGLALLIGLSALSQPALGQTSFPGGEGSRTLDTTGHPKAKGLQLRLDFPASWSLEEAKRPNSVAIAVSQQGRGLQNCVVAVQTADQLGWPPGQAEAETPASFAAPARLRRIVEDLDAEYLGGGPARIEGLPSRWVAALPKVARDGGDTAFPHVSYQVLYKNWLVSLTCGSGATTREAALASFRQHEALFRQIANSMVLPQRWK